MLTNIRSSPFIFCYYGDTEYTSQSVKNITSLTTRCRHRSSQPFAKFKRGRRDGVLMVLRRNGLLQANMLPELTCIKRSEIKDNETHSLCAEKDGTSSCWGVYLNFFSLTIERNVLLKKKRRRRRKTFFIFPSPVLHSL